MQIGSGLGLHVSIDHTINAVQLHQWNSDLARLNTETPTNSVETREKLEIYVIVYISVSAVALCGRSLDLW